MCGKNGKFIQKIKIDRNDREIGKMKFGKLIRTCLAASLVACFVLAGCNYKEEITTEKVVEMTDTTLRVGALKGPTTMGLLYLMNEENVYANEMNYEFTMAAAADELLPLMLKGELDIVLVPANVASVLYAKSEGKVSVIDVNTLGVLYMVSGSECSSVDDLKGKTIYLTGKGTTPDYVLQYILSQNGFTKDDCVLEYKSEATEVAALLAQNPEAIGLLPQPFVTAACAQNEALKVVLDMNEEWNKLQGNGMVTGVTLVRRDVLTENETAVQAFLNAHEASAAAINANPEIGAVYAVKVGIVAKEAIAQKAIPECNITCMTGEEMKQALSAYLTVLFEQNPESVGGALPGEDFYYVP